MGGDAYTFKLFGLMFNWTNVLSGLAVFAIVFFLLFWLSRKLTMKPTGKQNVLEWFVDFTNGIVQGQMPAEFAPRYSFLGFFLFIFIFVANQFGLILQFGWGGHELLRSPTADPVITMTLSFSIMVLTHFVGVAQKGIFKYLKGYVKPYALLLPINLFEEFGNFLTLGLRLFGNIYAGELLMKMIAGLALPDGHLSLGVIYALPLSVLWQGFSVFIGAIQAYVFVTLTSVYISHKIAEE